MKPDISTPFISNQVERVEGGVVGGGVVVKIKLKSLNTTKSCREDHF